MINFETAVLNAKSWEGKVFLRPYIIDSIWFRHFAPCLPKHVNDIDSADSIFIWSDQITSSLEKRKFLLDSEGNIKKPVVVFEDCFIRNVDMYKNKNSEIYNKKYAFPIGFTYSNFAHYDIRGHGTLESYLTDKFIPLSESQKNRARYCMQMIIKNRISKYNNQKLLYNLKNKNGLKILIIDQVAEDQSVLLSNANHLTFKTMLDKAFELTDNVSVKIHAEQLVGRRNGYFTNVNAKDKINVNDYKLNLIAEKVNPISLLENFDEVWTVSSQMGFEALMLGKTVRCFGVPFYSGYGLTIDYAQHPVLKFRNNYKHTVEDIFYNAYIRYAHYRNYYDRNIEWQIEDVIDHLIRQSKQFPN